MAEDTLVDRADLGLNLIKALDRAKFPVDALVWVYYPEADRWRLLLATERIIKARNLQEILLEIDSIIDSSSDEMPDLSDITIVTKDEPLIKDISSLVRIGGTSVARMSKNTFNGTYVEDLIAYRTAS